MKLSDFGVGEIVSFTYDRGSIPGARRKVRITEVRTGGITGVDLDIQADRSFLDEYAKDVKLVDRTFVNFVEAKSEIENNLKSVTGEELADIYKTVVCNADNFSCSFDVNTGNIVVDEENEVEANIVECSSNPTLFFGNSKQQSMMVSLKDNKLIFDGKIISVVDFAAKLADFYK